MTMNTCDCRKFITRTAYLNSIGETSITLNQEATPMVTEDEEDPIKH